MKRFRTSIGCSTRAAAYSRLKLAVAMLFAAVCSLTPALRAQESPTSDGPPAPIVRSVPMSDQQQTQAIPPPHPEAAYDPALFLKPIPPDQLAFINQYARQPSSELYRDKQFHKLLKSLVPDCMFHYGRDMPLDDALDITFDHSRVPVVITDGRYVLLAGTEGPYLAGRGFLWLDLQQGILLGGFYFHPTNGEPTPALNIFSRQIKEDALGLAELPPAFNEALLSWTVRSNIPPVTARYFITGSNKKILLEHDENLCAAYEGARPSPEDCNRMSEEAADADLNAADYVEQTHHATNATAWMLSGEQVAWIGVRDHTCGGLADPLGCRVRMTRERVRVISRPPGPHGPHR